MINTNHLSKIDDESDNISRTDTFFLDDKVLLSIVAFKISAND